MRYPESFKLGDLTVVFRDAGPADEAMVFSAWLSGHRDGGDWPRMVSAWRYFGQHKLVLQRILARSDCVVACNLSRPTQVLGFICWQHALALHWVFVKQVFRRKGLGSALLARAFGTAPGVPDACIPCSHWTRGIQRMWDRKRWQVVYHPFLLEADYEATKDRVQRPLRDSGGNAHEGSAREELHASGVSPGTASVLGGSWRGDDAGGPDGGHMVPGRGGDPWAS